MLRELSLSECDEVALDSRRHSAESRLLPANVRSREVQLRYGSKPRTAASPSLPAQGSVTLRE